MEIVTSTPWLHSTGKACFVGAKIVTDGLGRQQCPQAAMDRAAPTGPSGSVPEKQCLQGNKNVKVESLSLQKAQRNVTLDGGRATGGGKKAAFSI